MMNRIALLLMIVGFLVGHSQAFAQRPDFTGTWILNLEKSKLESQPAGMTSSIFIIKQDGNKFKLTRYHVFGGKKKKLNLNMLADGETRRLKLFFKSKLEWKENNLRASIWRKNFSNIVTYKFGKTQNEFVAEEVFKNKSNNHHNIWVFDKEIKNNIP
jgi:hypothetical protein